MADTGQLVVWRRTAGLTQEGLAEKLGVDRATVGRWEHGKKEPYPWQIPPLARALGRDAEEVAAALGGQKPGTASQSSPQALPAPAVAAPSWDDLSATVADWTALGTVVTTQPERTLWVTTEDLVLVGQMLAMFRQLDHTYGARHHSERVTDYIDRELGGLLQRPASTPEVAHQRAMLTAEYCELAGYQAVDNGRPDRAQVYYQRALSLSTSVGDQAYSAYLTAVNLGHLALHCGRPELALQWASSARDAATAASPATRAAVTAVVARANARLGREREATSLILEAESLLGTTRGEDPAWIGYFTPAYLADEAAHCLHDLGRPPAARSQLVDALDGVGDDRVRRRAIDAALLASTWVASGDLDRACAVGRQAVEFTARTGSGRCIERVGTVLAALRPHRGYGSVRELRDFTHAVLPEALLRPDGA
ncbi:helix-turn-helix transcriptional regulator [Kitasatospora griseola]